MNYIAKVFCAVLAATLTVSAAVDTASLLPSSTFRIQDPDSGLYWGIDGFLSEPAMELEIFHDESVFMADQGRFALHEVNYGDWGFVRHADRLLRLNALNEWGPAFDFAWQFWFADDGATFAVHNDYDFGDGLGSFIGLDKDTNQLILLPPGDERIKQWRYVNGPFATEEPSVHVDPISNDGTVVAEPISYSFYDIETGKHFGHQGFLADKTESARFEFVRTQEINDGNDAYFALRDVDLGDAGFIRHQNRFIQSDLLFDNGVANDFKWFLNFEPNSDAVQICNDYILEDSASYSCIAAVGEDQKLMLVPQLDANWWRMYSGQEEPVFHVDPIFEQPPTAEEPGFVSYTSNPFHLQHKESGLFLGEGFALTDSFDSSLRLEEVYDSRVYLSEQGRFALHLVGADPETEFVHHMNYMFYLGSLNAEGALFDYTFTYEHSDDGSVKIFNDYDFGDGRGSYIGVEPSVNQLVLVHPDDSRVASWVFLSDDLTGEQSVGGFDPVYPPSEEPSGETITPVEEPMIIDAAPVNFPGTYYIAHASSGLVWSDNGMVEPLAENAMEIELFYATDVYLSNHGRFALRNVRFGNAGFIRHYFYFLQMNEFEPENYDFAWYFEFNSDGSFIIRNDYLDGWCVGVDPETNLLLIVPMGDERVASWNLIRYVHDSAQQHPAMVVDKAADLGINNESSSQEASSTAEQKGDSKSSPAIGSPIIIGSSVGALGLIVTAFAVYKFKGAPKSKAAHPSTTTATGAALTIVTERRKSKAQKMVQASAPPMPSSPKLE